MRLNCKLKRRCLKKNTPATTLFKMGKYMKHQVKYNKQILLTFNISILKDNMKLFKSVIYSYF